MESNLVRKVDLVDNEIQVCIGDDNYYLYNIGITIPKHRWDKDKRSFFFPKENVYVINNQYRSIEKTQAFLDYLTELDTKEAMIAMAAQKKLDSLNLDLPINGRTLYNHQKEAIRRVLETRRIILAHDPGCGKTTTTLVALGMTDLPIYIISPRGLHEMWRREAALLGVKIAGTYSSDSIPEDPPVGDFALAVDECHYFNSYESQRTNKFLKFSFGAMYNVLISGTPMKNGRPSNLFPLLKAIRHKLSLNKRNYELSFCKGRYRKFSSKFASGASNLKTLHRETADVILRKKINDCVDLPKKTRNVRNAEVSQEAKGVYEDVFNTLKNGWNERLRKGEVSSQSEKLVMFTQLRHASSLAKVFEAAKMAKEFADSEKQAVFFVAFKDTATMLQNELSYLGQTGLLLGDVSQKDRQEVIDTFQKGETRFVVSTFGSGGIGVTLTNANDVVLVDLPWTSAEALQAEARAYRIGLDHPVFCTWIQANNTDKVIDNMILTKQKNISTVLTGDLREEIQFDLRQSVDRVLDEIFK